jgi:hypothetical protein
VGSNPKSSFRQAARYVVMISRIQTMEPDSDANVARFLRSYEKFKCYYLMAAGLCTTGPEILHGSALLKRGLHIRHAWEIGVNDPDGATIFPGDAPIIPAGQENVPVLELLKWKKQGHKAHSPPASSARG